MFNWYYKLRMNTMSPNIKDDLAKAIKTSELYDISKNVENIEDKKLPIEYENNPVMVYHNDYGNRIYDWYFRDLHIHIANFINQTIYSIRVKHPDEKWNVDFNDPSHPINDTYEVYIWYDIPVLDVTRTEGYVYKSGFWNKNVFIQLSKFFRYVEGKSVNSIFNSLYKKSKP